MPSPIETRLVRLEAVRDVTPWDRLVDQAVADWPQDALGSFLVAMASGADASRRALRKLSDTRLDELIACIRAHLPGDGSALENEATFDGDTAVTQDEGGR
ncbi:hypothetical protein GXW71_28210 [Roseomonas hellenica]|uniref:Uncharacterized protein n=1 Tax=Plastoroseomonas hellenica TaxID=2687306 RepID=A0ABS5F6U4_9PROT|nr:hypothetical protein [Plastoroseomonas hellenica]MBR0668269.1 hypothetical protein [Plastoroseomonas hellenica]